MKTKHIILIVLICLLPGCSLISVTQKHYKNDQGTAPKEKLLSFESQEAMAAGATLNNVTAAEVYYKGTEPQSPQAKILYDMSYRFMAFIGVNNNFDPTDPESLKKTFEAADKAIQEKDKNLAELRQAVDDYRTKLEGEKKIVRDKEAEMKAQDGKWSAKWGSLFYCFIGLLILIPVGAIVIQITTGVPLATGLFSGALKTFGKFTKQTVQGLEQFKKELAETKVDASATNEEKEEAKYWLDALSNTLSKTHDQDVKDYVALLKKKV